MYTYSQLDLSKDEFDNLMLFGPPNRARDKFEGEGDWLNHNLCYQPLKKATENVLGLTPVHSSAKELFDSIPMKANKADANPWFSRHALISEHFHKDLMDRIWLRNLSKGWETSERTLQPDCSLYLIEGNKRSLVYSVKLALGEVEYEPVKALHAEKWDVLSGVLDWSGWPSDVSVLENDGKYLDEDGYNWERTYTDDPPYTIIVNGTESSNLVRRRLLK